MIDEQAARRRVEENYGCTQPVLVFTLGIDFAHKKGPVTQVLTDVRPCACCEKRDQK